MDISNQEVVARPVPKEVLDRSRGVVTHQPQAPHPKYTQRLVAAKAHGWTPTKVRK